MTAMTAPMSAPATLVQRDDKSAELRKAKDRQESLLRRTPAGTGFSWLLDRQIMFHSRRIYVHDGPTDTMPTHDLAHLLVGMSSSLPWCPAGTDAEVRMSEFNAAVLENLLSYAYEHVACRSVTFDAILPKTLQYARWFVEMHYSPFPIPLQEAYRRFCLGIDADAIATLSHYFFTQKALEHHGGQRERPSEMRLIRRPATGLDAPTQAYQAVIRNTVQFMKARQAGPGSFVPFL
jgi:hypothetical protein